MSQRTDREQAQAVVNAMYDACKVALESPGGLMPPRDYFEKLLGDTAQGYEIRGYEEIAAERDKFRELLAEARGLLGSLALVTEGPNAGWRGDGEDVWYDDDEVPHPDCKVEALRKRIDMALDEKLRGGS